MTDSISSRANLGIWYGYFCIFVHSQFCSPFYSSLVPGVLLLPSELIPDNPSVVSIERTSLNRSGPTVLFNLLQSSPEVMGQTMYRKHSFKNQLQNIKFHPIVIKFLSQRAKDRTRNNRKKKCSMVF